MNPHSRNRSAFTARAGEAKSSSPGADIAAAALFYVRDIQNLEDYREFFRSFYTPAVDDVVVSRTFETREEADAWLAQGDAKDGERVKIAGQGFRVIPARQGGGWRFLRSPLPEELMKEQ